MHKTEELASVSELKVEQWPIASGGQLDAHGALQIGHLMRAIPLRTATLKVSSAQSAHPHARVGVCGLCG